MSTKYVAKLWAWREWKTFWWNDRKSSKTWKGGERSLVMIYLRVCVEITVQCMLITWESKLKQREQKAPIYRALWSLHSRL